MIFILILFTEALWSAHYTEQINQVGHLVATCRINAPLAETIPFFLHKYKSLYISPQHSGYFTFDYIPPQGIITPFSVVSVKYEEVGGETILSKIIFNSEERDRSEVSNSVISLCAIY